MRQTYYSDRSFDNDWRESEECPNYKFSVFAELPH